MARRSLITTAITVAFLVVAAPAFACGGLIGPRGSVNLLRTTTLAGYHNGNEHYLTSFQFAGAGGEFGSLVPLPGIPSKVERGGQWTLQRLIRETTPVPEFADSAGFASATRASKARVILETRIDALDITVLEGGADAVATWAEEHGFVLSPDAPEVLEFYAKRSPIFAAARFNGAEARRRGTQAGDGTPIHFTIPTQQPWVPLRILALGKEAIEPVEADIYLLTDREPALLAGTDPAEIGSGLELVRSERASASLMADLRADKGNGWIPRSMWLTYLRMNVPSSEVRYDLAIDASGAGVPSPVAAGIVEAVRRAAREAAPTWPVFMALGAILALLAGRVARRGGLPAAP